jgi:mannosyltransferase
MTGRRLLKAKGTSATTIAAATAIIAALISIFGLTAKDVWYDELFTLDAASRGMTGLVEHLWEFPLVPYYAFMLIWTGSGSFNPEWWLRLPSVAGFATAAALTSATAYRICGKKAAFVAGILVATNPLLIRYAQEARPYALGTALAAASTYFLVRWAPRPQVRWVALYSTTVILLTVFFLPGLLILVPQAAYVLANRHFLRMTRKDFRLTVLVLVLTLIFAVPYSARTLESRGPVMHSWLEVPDLTGISEGLYFLGFAVPLAIWGISLLTRSGAVWALGSLAGIVAVWLVSQAGSSWWIQRSFLPLVLTLAIGASCVAQRASRLQIMAATMLLAVLTLPKSLESQLAPDGSRWEMPAAREVIDRSQPSRDVHLREIPENLAFAVTYEGRKYGIGTRIDDPVRSTNYWTVEPNPDDSCEFVSPISENYSWFLCAIQTNKSPE